MLEPRPPVSSDGPLRIIRTGRPVRRQCTGSESWEHLKSGRSWHALVCPKGRKSISKRFEGHRQQRQAAPASLHETQARVVARSRQEPRQVAISRWSANRCFRRCVCEAAKALALSWL